MAEYNDFLNELERGNTSLPLYTIHGEGINATVFEGDTFGQSLNIPNPLDLLGGTKENQSNFLIWVLIGIAVMFYIKK